VAVKPVDRRKLAQERVRLPAPPAAPPPPPPVEAAPPEDDDEDDAPSGYDPASALGVATTTRDKPRFKKPHPGKNRR
jgi:hypothetical protein